MGSPWVTRGLPAGYPRATHLPTNNPWVQPIRIYIIDIVGHLFASYQKKGAKVSKSISRKIYYSKYLLRYVIRGN